MSPASKISFVGGENILWKIPTTRNYLLSGHLLWWSWGQVHHWHDRDCGQCLDVSTWCGSPWLHWRSSVTSGTSVDQSEVSIISKLTNPSSVFITNWAILVWGLETGVLATPWLRSHALVWSPPCARLCWRNRDQQTQIWRWDARLGAERVQVSFIKTWSQLGQHVSQQQWSLSFLILFLFYCLNFEHHFYIFVLNIQFIVATLIYDITYIN